MKDKISKDFGQNFPMFEKHIWRKGEVEDLMETIFYIKRILRFLEYAVVFLIGMVLAVLLEI